LNLQKENIKDPLYNFSFSFPLANQKAR